jgi:peptidoglycan/LPS O-acetylase OafA/YrhL
MKNNRLDYVDVLRGIAILGVIAVHTSLYGSFNVPNIGRTITGNGQYGVQLFYIASAFTLCLSLRNRMNTEHKPLRNFFIRRFFRIAPMFYVAIFVYYFGFYRVLGISVMGSGGSIPNLLAHFTFLHGFSPFWINTLVPGGWSVAVEVMFYAILPFLFPRIKNINQAFTLFMITTIICPFFNLLLSKLIPIVQQNYYLDMYLPNQFAVFCLGIIVYFSIANNEKIHTISAKNLFSFAICFLAQLAAERKIFFPTHVLFGIGFALFTVALSQYKLKIFINPVFIYIGKISFSMYLIHFGIYPILEKFHFVNYVNNDIINYFIRFFIVTGIAVALATMSYNLIEVPGQKIGKKIISNMENRG